MKMWKNSSTPYGMETVMTFSCIYLDVSFLRFIRTSRRHNASLFQNVVDMVYTNPTAKVRIIFEFLTILRGDLVKFFGEVTTFDSLKPRRAKGFTFRL